MKIASYIFVEDFVDDPTKCFKLYDSLFFEVPDLNSNHLEADSRIFCHIFDAVKIQAAHIIIISADTDVFILGIYFWNKLTHFDCLGLWFDSSDKKKFISGCHLAAQSLGKNICHILPAIHSLFVIFCQHYTLQLVAI